MTDETSYLRIEPDSSFDVFRFDVDGKLTYIHPAIIEGVDRQLVDTQGLTVWQRLEAVDRAVLQVSSRMDTLEREYAEMCNELSILASVQRTQLAQQAQIAALHKRLKVVEDETPTLYGFGESVAQQAQSSSIPTFVPFDSIAKLVEQVESMFTCKNGDPRGSHRVWNAALGDYEFHEYTLLGLIAPSSIPGAPERLRQAMYTSFHKLRQTCKSDRPVLYWRYAAQERMQEDVEYRHSSFPPEPAKYKIMTRVAIPEADFSVVAGMVKRDNDPYSVIVQ